MRVYNSHRIDEKAEAWFVCHVSSHMASTAVDFINSSLPAPPPPFSSAMALYQRTLWEPNPTTSFRSIKGTDQDREPPGRKARQGTM